MKPRCWYLIFSGVQLSDKSSEGKMFKLKNYKSLKVVHNKPLASLEISIQLLFKTPNTTQTYARVHLWFSL